MHNALDLEGRRMLDMRNQNMTHWMGKLPKLPNPGSSAAFSVFFNFKSFFFKIREDTLASSIFFPTNILLFRIEIHLMHPQQLY